MKQDKLMLDERNNANRKLSINKIRGYLGNGEIITEFDKDAFEILIKQVIVGGYDEKENADVYGGLAWIDYNLKRSLCIENKYKQDEITLAENEVIHSLKEIKYNISQFEKMTEILLKNRR